MSGIEKYVRANLAYALDFLKQLPDFDRGRICLLEEIIEIVVYARELSQW